MTRPDGQTIEQMMTLIDAAIADPASRKPGPTKAQPGSPEKNAVLCHRLEQLDGTPVSIFDPADAQYHAGLDGTERA